MDLSREEIKVLRGLLERSHETMSSDFDNTRALTLMRLDPLAAALVGHQPFENASGRAWACSCNNKAVYVSLNHVVLTHIKPIVERAATKKVGDILARAGMDLDVIIKSDKIFGEYA